MGAFEPSASERKGASLGARLRWPFDRFADLEFTSPLAFTVLAVVYVASRIPWLDQGYGNDPDAWRVALSAQHFWSEGEYLPSRLPGFPLHELVTAAVWEQGWVWTNLSTVLISLAGVYLFARVAREMELPNRGILTLGFAFAPFLWINSVMTIDYMWALTFLLAAYLALLRRSPTLAGVCLGIAAGFRLTSLAMLLPFWLLLARTGRRGEIFSLTRMSAAIVLFAYLPVLMEYGFKLLNFYDESVSWEVVVRSLGKDGLGVIGALAVLAALALSVRRLRRFPGDLLRDPQVLTWTTAVLVFAALYARLPHEVAYLIPIFPFGFFLLSRYVGRWLLLPAIVVVVLAGFVDLHSSDDTLDIGTNTVTSARLGDGMLFTDLETRQDQLDYARELREITAGEKLELPALVVVGSIYPELAMLFRDELEIVVLDEDDREAISPLSDPGRACDPSCDVLGSVQYVSLLDSDRLGQLIREGMLVYFTADAARRTLALFGYRIEEAVGLQPPIELALALNEPPLGEGAAPIAR